MKRSQNLDGNVQLTFFGEPIWFGGTPAETRRSLVFCTAGDCLSGDSWRP